MKRILSMFIGVMVVSFLFLCCDRAVEEPNTKRNILFYIATDSDATIDRDTPGKIDSIRAGWKPENGEMLIYVDRRGQDALFMRINDTFANGLYGLDTLANYGEENSADPAVFKRMIDALFGYSADCYGLIFFSHSSGWLPAGALNNPYSSETNEHPLGQMNFDETELRSLVIDNGGSSRQEMEYYDFASSIPDNSLDFIILESCLMSDVMSTYELRNKAQYVLASSAEIVAPGFTYIYRNNIMRLYDTKSPVQSIVSAFAQSQHNFITRFPESSAYCSSTLGVIKMSEMHNLAITVKTLLNGTQLDESTLAVGTIQQFDRPRAFISSPPQKSRYFDLGDVIANLTSAPQYAIFNAQLEKTVVWKANTRNFLMGDGGSYGFSINVHSGLTTYIQQTGYEFLNSTYENSLWYKTIYE